MYSTSSILQLISTFNLLDPDVICNNLIDLFQHLGADRSDVVFDDQIVTIRHDTERLMNAVEQFQRLQDRGQFDEQQIADQLELEMRATANAIRTAEEKFKVSHCLSTFGSVLNTPSGLCIY